MKKMFVIFGVTLFFFSCSSNSDSKSSREENFVKAYSDMVLLQAKEEYAKQKKMMFSKKDSVMKIFDTYKITEEEYRQKVEGLMKKMTDWNEIQDQAKKYLQEKLKEIEKK